MITRTSLILALISLPVIASSGADKSGERRELQANRAKWDKHHIAGYEFRLRDEKCFCLHALGYGPFRTVVKQGKVIRAIYEGERRDGYWPGRAISKKTYEKTDLIATVEEVFARAEKVVSLADRPHTIRYDPEYGFPILIDVDNPPGWADAQWRLVVDGFRPNMTVTAGNGNAPAATQTFSLTVVTRFDNYAASFGLTGADALPLADANGDGMSNLLAYALGLNPAANNSGFEQGTVRNYGGLDYLSIRFNRSSVATDLTYIVEASNDLAGSWTELAHSNAGGVMTASGGVVVSDTGGPPTYLDEVRDTVAIPAPPANPERILRLRVTSP